MYFVISGSPNCNISDFEQFSFKPEMFSNLVSISNANLRDSISFRNKVVSSASCVILKAELPILTPFIFISLQSVIARVSAATRNSKAERGPPCLTPEVILKYFEVTPLFITQL